MQYQLISRVKQPDGSITQTVVKEGTQQECQAFLLTYPAGSPPLSFEPVAQ